MGSGVGYIKGLLKIVGHFKKTFCVAKLALFDNTLFYPFLLQKSDKVRNLTF